MKKIAIVDNKDKVIDGVYHYQITDEIKRIAAVIIIKSNGNILLSKKSLLKDKKERIGYSAGGHVNLFESYEHAAVREAIEELGVSVELQEEIAYFPHFKDGKQKSFHKVFLAINDGPYYPDEEEIQSIVEFNIDTLRKEILNNPAQFNKNTLFALKILLEKNICR